jgi:hypothetical protein
VLQRNIEARLWTTYYRVEAMSLLYRGEAASQRGVESRLCRHEPMVGASGFRPLNATNDHEDSIGVARISSYNPPVTRFQLIGEIGTSAAFRASARHRPKTTPCQGEAERLYCNSVPQYL